MGQAGDERCKFGGGFRAGENPKAMRNEGNCLESETSRLCLTAISKKRNSIV
jgi:hypothetical protein